MIDPLRHLNFLWRTSLCHLLEVMVLICGSAGWRWHKMTMLLATGQTPVRLFERGQNAHAAMN